MRQLAAHDGVAHPVAAHTVGCVARRLELDDKPARLAPNREDRAARAEGQQQPLNLAQGHV